jgi:hypothetical protein
MTKGYGNFGLEMSCAKMMDVFFGPVKMRQGLEDGVERKLVLGHLVV